jgi:hypothetical protein
MDGRRVRRGDGFNTRAAEARDRAVYTARGIQQVVNDINLVKAIAEQADSTTKVNLGTLKKEYRDIAKTEMKYKIRDSFKKEAFMLNDMDGVFNLQHKPDEVVHRVKLAASIAPDNLGMAGDYIFPEGYPNFVAAPGVTPSELT